MKKNNKKFIIGCQVTAELKEQLEEYARARDLNVSQVLRRALLRQLESDGVKKEKEK